jgi:CDP-diacylglycerol--inositol 3-phosphatidyltransferase
MYYSFDAPATAMVYYFLGQGMDAIDGVAARALGQVSSFGAMLDMLTDRMGTAVLSVVLSHLYPSMWGFFTFLIVLDTVSHWFQMYATATSGKKTHKGSANPLLNFYYTFPYALLVFCCLNELFFICAYLMAHYSHPLLNAAAAVSFPVFVAKQFMNVVQVGTQTLTHTQIFTILRPVPHLFFMCPHAPRTAV